VIVAMTLGGIEPRQRIEGAINAAGLEAYVRHIVAPTLRPGQIIIADDLCVPTMPRWRTAPSRRDGGTHCPYSPDLNPIDHAFGKVKQAVRHAWPRTDDDLRTATESSFAAPAPVDAHGWFAY
jgi:transposase